MCLLCDRKRIFKYCLEKAGLSSRRAGFDPRPVRVTFVVGKVTGAQVFLRVHRPFTVSINPPAVRILPQLHSTLNRNRKGRILWTFWNTTHLYVEYPVLMHTVKCVLTTYTNTCDCIVLYNLLPQIIQQDIITCICDWLSFLPSWLTFQNVMLVLKIAKLWIAKFTRPWMATKTLHFYLPLYNDKETG
jgi:hypothetical protein